MTVHRLKTYASSQGYVYLYYFTGQKKAAGNGTEYLFDVTIDRTQTYTVSVSLPCGAVEFWASSHGRELSDSEQYAAVKLRLFRAFDEIPNMPHDGRALSVDADFLEESLASLGVD